MHTVLDASVELNLDKSWKIVCLVFCSAESILKSEVNRYYSTWRAILEYGIKQTPVPSSQVVALLNKDSVPGSQQNVGKHFGFYSFRIILVPVKGF